MLSMHAIVMAIRRGDVDLSRVPNSAEWAGEKVAREIREDIEMMRSLARRLAPRREVKCL